MLVGIYVKKLLGVLGRLADAGNTVIVIEHNLEVIKTADYIIDLGPEGGDRGGEIVAKGTPEECTAVKASYTGRFLREVLSHRAAAVTQRLGAVVEDPPVREARELGQRMPREFARRQDVHHVPSQRQHLVLTRAGRWHRHHNPSEHMIAVLAVDAIADQCFDARAQSLLSIKSAHERNAGWVHAGCGESGCRRCVTAAETAQPSRLKPALSKR